MNNKGQSLVAFIIIMPILLILIGIVIEYNYVLYNKRHITNTTKDIIANCIDRCQKDDIIEIYNKNGIEVSNLELVTDNGYEIKFTTKVKSYLKSILDSKDYTINIDIIGKKDNDKIKYEKGN